jgi:hypothetical protein
MLLEQHGIPIAAGLLILVSACAFLLARKAAKQVALFREEQHERFQGLDEG